MNRRNLLELGALFPFVPFLKSKSKDNEIRIGDRIKTEGYIGIVRQIEYAYTSICNYPKYRSDYIDWDKKYPNWRNKNLIYYQTKKNENLNAHYNVVPEQGVEKL